MKPVALANLMPYTERKRYGSFVIILRYTEKGGTLTNIKVEGHTESFTSEAAAKKWIDQQDLKEATTLPLPEPGEDQPRRPRMRL